MLCPLSLFPGKGGLLSLVDIHNAVPLNELGGQVHMGDAAEPVTHELGQQVHGSSAHGQKSEAKRS